MDTSVDASASVTEDLRRPVPSQCRFALAFLGLFMAVVAALYVLKTIYVVAHWPELRSAGSFEVGKALLVGLRFTGSAAAMLLAPAMFLWYAMAIVPRRALRTVFAAYIGCIAFLIPVTVISDFLYFQESGKHFTYEATAYLGTDAWPMVSGAFSMHPWALFGALAGCIVAGVAGAIVGNRLARAYVPAENRPQLKWLLTLPVIGGLGLLCLRGGVGKFNMTVGDAVISADPYINALCLDPVYAVLRTAMSPEASFQFYTEADNIRTVRELLGIPESQAISERYPLLRESPGTPQGNRMNVVIFLLESWSGKDIGCLGGVAKVTPFFDELAAQGWLFRNAFATGIRTAEGAFSILCSFPNQPVKPIMNRYSVLQNRWRSLPQVLEDAGYENLFIHGRDLDFDHMRNFLFTARFHRIIDRRDFPVAAALENDSWPGAHDEEVVRRADEEFAKITDHPFLGMIYTMNTHPPFAVPEGYPLVRKPDSESNHFLNSLNYTDHTLRVFFDLAKKRDYYRNTVFVLVADHARTRGFFTFATQHHIPILFFSPGHIEPRSTWLVASQLDIMPTLLSLLQIKTRHACWGRDLTALDDGEGFAPSFAGGEYRWRNRQFLINDGLTESRPMLFDLTSDPDCRRDAWEKFPRVGEEITRTARAYLSLSDALLNENRAYPPEGE